MISRRAFVIGAAAVSTIASTPKLFAADGDGAVSISVKDSPLPNALDVYYSSLVDLSRMNGFSSSDRLLLGNTITTFDISKDTPYYNEGLFERFADRIFLQSPDSIGPANQADRFSLQYETVIKTAADSIDQRHPEIVPKLTELSKAVEKKTEELSALIVKFEKEWASIAGVSGIKPGDSDYDLRYLNFLEKARYADQVDIVSGRIDALLGRVEQVRRSVYAPHEIVVLEAVAQLSSTRKIARPRRPQYERTISGVNELTFADPKTRLESVCDISAPSLPLGDLVKFLSVDGYRKPFDITKSSVVTERHEKTWSSAAEAKVSFFGIGIGGGGGGSGSSSFAQTINDAAGIKVAFDNISEVLVDRGYWFNPAIFEDQRLAKIIAAIPGSDRLKYVSVSLIIARGLELTLTSSSSVDTNTWSKQNIAGRGGCSFFGFSFGGGGGSSNANYNISVSSDGKSVTFKDDGQVTRVLAVRLVEMVLRPVNNMAPTLMDFPADEKPQRNPIGVPVEEYRNFVRGRINYLDLNKAKFPGGF